MKKRLTKCLAILACLPLLFSCGNDEAAVDMQTPEGSFKLKAVVKDIGEIIEVEVIESDYAFGIYHVRVGDETEYYNEAGKKINKDGISTGDTVEIIYGGQVMMSYPPQIVASRIQKK